MCTPGIVIAKNQRTYQGHVTALSSSSSSSSSSSFSPVSNLIIDILPILIIAVESLASFIPPPLPLPQMGESEYIYRTLDSDLGALYVRSLGANQWTRLPYLSIREWGQVQNVIKPTFKPGMMSVVHQEEEAAIVDGRLVKPLYLWKSTFSFSELYNVRVKEYEIGGLRQLGLRLTRIELVAVCKAPPTGQFLESRVGSEEQTIYNDCVETSKRAPGRWKTAAAQFSDRWRHGYQEIRLTFSRSRQVVRPQKDAPKDIKRIAGTMHWIWDAFLAFLCGYEWSAPSQSALDSAVQALLHHAVASQSKNPFAELKRIADNWVLVKP